MAPRGLGDKITEELLTWGLVDWGGGEGLWDMETRDWWIRELGD